MKTLRRLGATTFLALTLAACGSDSEDEPAGDGSGGSGGGGNLPSSVPSEITEAAFTSFLESSSYKQTNWVSETAGPRDASNSVSPHGRVRVWFNPTVIESIEAGNGASTDAPPHSVGSMVVKELYDDQDALVGHAVSLKLEEGKGGNVWQYYCKGPNGRCYSGSTGFDTTPMFKKGDLQCGGCHGGIVFTPVP